MGFQTDATNFAKTFGNAPKAGDKNNNSAVDDRPKAQYWLNVGYEAPNILEGEEKARFISLPVGIPLDTMEPAKVSGQNQVWLQQQAARNDLLEQLMEQAQSLAPGETKVLTIQIELRHVAEDAAPVDPAKNVFIAPRLFG